MFHPPAWAKRSRRRGSTASTSPLGRAVRPQQRDGENRSQRPDPFQVATGPEPSPGTSDCQRPFRCSTNTGGRRSPGRREPGVASRRRVARRRSRRNVTRSQRLAWQSHPDEHGRCLLSQRPCKRGASGPLSNGVEPCPVNRSFRLKHADPVGPRQAESGYRLGLQAGGRRFDPGTLQQEGRQGRPRRIPSGACTAPSRLPRTLGPSTLHTIARECVVIRLWCGLCGQTADWDGHVSAHRH